MTEELELVTRLQSVDQRIAEYRQRIAALPKHVAQIEKALDSHLRRLEADRAALAGNHKERKRLEDDIKVNEQKISKLKDQTLLAKTNEQYRAFQHEIEFCEKEIRKAEDRILDLMGEADPLDQNVRKAETALKQEKQQVDAEKSAAREETVVDQKLLDALQSERSGIVARIKPVLYRAYEHIRKKWNGWAVAEVVAGRCTACYISLRPQYLQDLRQGGEVMFCESCGRIHFYNPPVSVEHDLAAHPSPSA